MNDTFDTTTSFALNLTPSNALNLTPSNALTLVPSNALTLVPSNPASTADVTQSPTGTFKPCFGEDCEGGSSDDASMDTSFILLIVTCILFGLGGLVSNIICLFVLFLSFGVKQGGLWLEVIGVCDVIYCLAIYPFEIYGLASINTVQFPYGACVLVSLADSWLCFATISALLVATTYILGNGLRWNLPNAKQHKSLFLGGILLVGLGFSFIALAARPEGLRFRKPTNPSKATDLRPTCILRDAALTRAEEVEAEVVMAIRMILLLIVAIIFIITTLLFFLHRNRGEREFAMDNPSPTSTFNPPVVRNNVQFVDYARLVDIVDKVVNRGVSNRPEYTLDDITTWVMIVLNEDRYLIDQVIRVYLDSFRGTFDGQITWRGPELRKGASTTHVCEKVSQFLEPHGLAPPGQSRNLAITAGSYSKISPDNYYSGESADGETSTYSTRIPRVRSQQLAKPAAQSGELYPNKRLDSLSSADFSEENRSRNAALSDLRRGSTDTDNPQRPSRFVPGHSPVDNPDYRNPYQRRPQLEVQRSWSSLSHYSSDPPRFPLGPPGTSFDSAELRKMSSLDVQVLSALNYIFVSNDRQLDLRKEMIYQRALYRLERSEFIISRPVTVENVPPKTGRLESRQRLPDSTCDFTRSKVFSSEHLDDSKLMEGSIVLMTFAAAILVLLSVLPASIYFFLDASDPLILTPRIAMYEYLWTEIYYMHASLKPLAYFIVAPKFRFRCCKVACCGIKYWDDRQLGKRTR